MDQTFSQWPPSLWSEDALRWNFHPLSHAQSFDVVIVGAGYSGLWTAHHLLKRDSSLSIAILDAQQPGFGASGRNGGWCSAFSPMSLEAVAAQSSKQQAIELQQALIKSVDEIGSYIAKSDIECGWHKGGTLSFARIQPQLERIKASIRLCREFGFDESFLEFITADQADSRIHIPNSLGASYSPHCAALHPAQLVDGLVRQLQTQGVHFFGSTRVTRIEPHVVTAQTPRGAVTASSRWIIRATEGFTARMPQFRRDVAPLYSYMIATSPLTEKQWGDIGWDNRETISDGRNLVIYAQRTADGRIAFGGRGAPYQYSSRIGPNFDNNDTIHALIEKSMREMFPSIADIPVTHRWGGALGVHRDWFTSARIDLNTHIASLGGYVGDGVAFSYVAAKEVAQSILSVTPNHRPLPIVNHVSPRWEPEPLRYVGINSLLRLTSRADETETKTGRRSRFIVWLLGKLIP